MALIKTLWEGLGTTPQKRVRNLIWIITAATGSIILTLNLRFGYNVQIQQPAPCKCPGWWIQWGPAADINIDIKRETVTGGAK
jgi:hypothetical protein